MTRAKKGILGNNSFAMRAAIASVLAPMVALGLYGCGGFPDEESSMQIDSRGMAVANITLCSSWRKIGPSWTGFSRDVWHNIHLPHNHVFDPGSEWLQKRSVKGTPNLKVVMTNSALQEVYVRVHEGLQGMRRESCQYRVCVTARDTSADCSSGGNLPSDAEKSGLRTELVGLRVEAQNAATESRLIGQNYTARELGRLASLAIQFNSQTYQTTFTCADMVQSKADLANQWDKVEDMANTPPAMPHAHQLRILAPVRNELEDVYAAGGTPAYY